MGLDLRELVFHVIWVHGLDLFTGRCTQNLDYLHQLINATFAWEEWLSKHQFCHNATRGPYINVGRVVGSTKDEFGGSVVAGADIADIGFAGDEDLGGAKVTKLQNAGGGVEKEILGLDISVAYTDGMDVGKGAEELVHVELDLEHGHGLFEFGVVPAGAVDSFWDVFEH